MLTDGEVAAFVSKFDAEYDGKLSSFYNFSRVVSLAHFEATIRRLGIASQYYVGVVSGSEREPELKFLSVKSLKLLNFELDRKYDLDKDWESYPSEGFAFTICNQVLEHVFNPHLAFKNLCHQTAANGYIYVTIPTVNCIHGEPYFYSSGFHPRFLERLGKENGLELAEIGWWGSYKYMINAVSGTWLPQTRLGLGIHRLGDLRYPFQALKDGTRRDTRANPIITDCWALYKKHSP